MKLDLKVFFDLVKAKQKPYEDVLLVAMQKKVDWIKKTSTYDLNQRQKESIERDKTLIAATETYLAVQNQIITHLFEKLEQAQLEIGAHLFDKQAAEEALKNHIKKQQNGEVQSAA